MNKLPPCPTFPDPYHGVTEDREIRTQIVLDRKVSDHLHNCRPQRSTLQITVNILISKLYDRLITNGITSYDPARYEDAVRDCAIILGGQHRRTVDEPPPGAETPDRDDGPGTRRVEHVTKKQRRVPSDARINAALPRTSKRSNE